MQGDIDSLGIKIIEVINTLYNKGYLSSVGGNISCRVNDVVLITPSGKTKFSLTKNDLVIVDYQGVALSDGMPSSELPVHLEIYKKRPDVNCIVHAHPIYTVLVSMLIEESMFERARLTPESVIHIGNLKVLPFVNPGQEASEAISKVIEKADIVVIKNHGVFSTGKSLDEALSRIEVLEENSKLLYHLLLSMIRYNLVSKDLERYLLNKNEIEKILKTYKK